MKQLLSLLLLLVCCAACGGRATPAPATPAVTAAATADATPAATASLPPAETATPAPPDGTPLPTGSPSFRDQLNTRAAGVGLTATENALRATATPTLTFTPSITPTPNLPAGGGRAVTPHPLAIDADSAGQLQLLHEFGRPDLRQLDWTPDGKYLVVVNAAGIQLYDAVSLEPARFIAVERVEKVVFEPGGERAALIRLLDGAWRVEVWDITAGVRLANMAGSIDVQELRYIYFLANNQVWAYGLWSAEVPAADDPYVLVTWDAASGVVVSSKPDPFAGGYLIDLSPDTKTILLTNSLDEWNIRGVQTGETQRVTLGKGRAIFSSDGEYLIGLTSNNQEVISYRLASPRGEIKAPISCQSLFRSGQEIACFNPELVTLLDPATLQVKLAVSLPPGVAVSSAPNGDLLWMEGSDITIYHRSGPQAGKLGRLSFTSYYRLAAGVMEEDGRLMPVAASAVRFRDDITVWNLESGEELARLPVRSWVGAIVFGTDRRSLFFLGDGEIQWWNVLAQRLVYRFHLLEDYQFKFGVSFENDSLFIPQAYIQEPIDVLDLHSGAMAAVPGQYQSPTYTLYRLSPDFIALEKRQLMNETAIQLDDRVNGILVKLPYLMKDQYERIISAALSDDGRYLAVGSGAPGRVTVYDLTTRQLVDTIADQRLQGPADWPGDITNLAFCPGTHLLGMVFQVGDARLWDVDRRAAVFELPGAQQAAFTPDGRYLVTQGGGVIRVWGSP